MTTAAGRKSLRPLSLFGLPIQTRSIAIANQRGWRPESTMLWCGRNATVADPRLRFQSWWDMRARAYAPVGSRMDRRPRRSGGREAQRGPRPIAVQLFELREKVVALAAIEEDDVMAASERGFDNVPTEEEGAAEDQDS